MSLRNSASIDDNTLLDNSAKKSLTIEDQTSRPRYSNYNVLDKWSTPDWDNQTREAVRERLQEIPPIRFFSHEEAQILLAVAERIVPQSERKAAEKIPVVPWIDAKLFNDERDGYRYEDLPQQREAWRLGLAGINETAQTLFDGKSFNELDSLSQDVVLTHVSHGTACGTAWQRMPATRFFKNVLCITIVKTYYSHPLAWNEIGYSGPSSLRGHVRKWEGGVDPWEAKELW